MSSGIDRHSVYAVAINRGQCSLIMNDGSVLKLQNFVDRFGDDTDDIHEAVSAIAALPNGRWVVVDLTKFEPAVRH